MPFERRILGRAKPFLKALISEKGEKMEKKEKRSELFCLAVSDLLLSVLYNHSNKHSKRHDLCH